MLKGIFAGDWGKVISVDLSDPDMKLASVKFGEIIKDICIQWVDDVKVGEYVMAHHKIHLHFRY